MVCARCGHESETAFRFCPECGAPAPEEHALREERKTVTIVFCDVTGSTALGEELDPETLRHVMARYFDAMRAAIERHGGTVEKFIGDAVMAVFGIPRLHEDDAARAVRAASDMQRSLAALNDELDREYGTRLAARIGVNTGEVVTGTAERLATGDAVNVAARLEQAASPGDVLLGAQTMHLVREVADVQELEPLTLKGKAQPVRAFKLLDVRADVARRHRFGGVLVGRARELRRLRDAYEQACSDRAPQLFTVLGAAGIGKSRLVHEFVSTTAGATVVTGRCLPYGDGITYWALVEIVKQLGVEITDGPLATLLRESAEPTTPQAIATAAKGLFEEVARSSPLVVVLDDIHWAEPTLLDLIEHVADLSRDAPLVLLCMARPELREVRPNWGGGMLNATTVMLEPLATDDVEQLIGALGASDPELARRIVERADGNPLFVEEMVALVDEGGGVDVPASIQALLAARLDRLDDLERSVLGRASVEGQVFHADAVRALDPAGGEVDAAFVQLVRKDLVRPAAGAVGDAYRFRHLLIRDAAYGALAKAERAILHERFADWIDVAGTALVERDEVVAYHLEQAYRYHRELGRSDEAVAALAGRAIERLTAADEAALGRADTTAVAALRARAAELHGDSAAGMNLRLKRVAALVELGRFDEAQEELDRTAAWADANGDAVLAARVALRRAASQAYWDREFSLDPAIAAVERLVPVFEAAGDDAALAEAFETQARFVSWIGRFADADRLYSRAVDHAARSDEPRRRLVAYSWWLGVKRNGPFPVEEAIAFLDAIPEDLRESLAWNASRMRAALEALRGNFDEAHELIEGVAARARATGTMFSIVWSLTTTTQIAFLAGDWAAAERAAREAWEILGASGEAAVREAVGGFLAIALARQGRLEEAEAIALEAAGDHRPDRERDTRSWLALALVRASRGAFDEAERLARDSLRIVEATDETERRAEAWTVLGEVLARAGDASGAADAFDRAEQLYAERGAIAGVRWVRDVRGARERGVEWAG